MEPTIATLAPYLDVLRNQLATTLVARDKNASRVPLYAYRVLTVILARARVLPTLQQKALAELSGFLDELCAELGRIEGSLILAPQLVQHIRTHPDYEAAQSCLQTAVRLLIQQPSIEGAEIQRKIAEITATLQDALHQAVVDQDMTPVSADVAIEPLDSQRKQALRDYLRAQFPQDGALEIGITRRLVGGGSKITIMVELRNTTTLPGVVVVRGDMADSVTVSAVANEFQLVQLAHQTGMPVPTPYLLNEDHSVLGGTFMVTSRIEGRNIGDWFDVMEPSRAFAVGLAQALATLHRIPPEKAPWLPGSTTTVRERVEQEIRYYEEIWRGSGEASIAMEQGLAWLMRHMDFSDGQRSIIHRDVGCHNMLARNGELAALLDWETAAIGHPASDLMYAHVCVVQMMPWDEFLAEYEKAGGRIPGKDEIDFYRLLSAIYGMHYCYLTRTFIATGLNKSAEFSYAANRTYLHYEREVHRAVKLVLSRND